MVYDIEKDIEEWEKKHPNVRYYIKGKKYLIEEE